MQVGVDWFAEACPPPPVNEMSLGTVLATLCWDGVDLLEKESRSAQSILKSSSGQKLATFCDQMDFPPYATPIQVLSLLMTPVGDHYFTSRYCHRRSGRYYERLCIDLEQIGLWRQSLAECRRSLQDPCVKVQRCPPPSSSSPPADDGPGFFRHWIDSAPCTTHTKRTQNY
jgi:hypothetical protein